MDTISFRSDSLYEKIQSMKRRDFLVRTATALIVLVCIGLGVPQFAILSAARDRIFALSDVPITPVALVLGASVLPNQEPSAVLAHRLESAAELYHAGKVERLIMSGDSAPGDYDEVEVMKKSAIALGVLEADITTDPAGRRTLDSCRRAKEEFQTAELVIVTQRFHLPRALYLCEHMGIKAVGYAADKAEYAEEAKNEFREFLARVQAFWEVNFFTSFQT